MNHQRNRYKPLLLFCIVFSWSNLTLARERSFISPNDRSKDPPIRAVRLLKFANKTATHIVTLYGGKATLDCQISGNVNVTYLWYKIESKAGTGTLLSSQPFLELKNLDLSDSGHYTCIAHSQFDQIQRKFTVNGRSLSYFSI